MILHTPICLVLLTDRSKERRTVVYRLFRDTQIENSLNRQISQQKAVWPLRDCIEQNGDIKVIRANEESVKVHFLKVDAFSDFPLWSTGQTLAIYRTQKSWKNLEIWLS